MKRLVVDVSGMVYRSAWAELQLGSGPVIVAREVLQALASYASRMGVYELILTYDGGRDARQQLYAEYKKKRKDNELRELVRQSIEVILQLCTSLPCIQLRIWGVEADDIIAEVARRFRPLTIMARDSDLWQLTHLGGVNMLDYDGTPIQLDLPPSQHLAYKVLVGDVSDNIKGVARVGDKTARVLLQEHGSLKHIMRWAKKEGRLGSMPYKEALEVVQRNLQLMKLDGSLLHQDDISKILYQYDHDKNELSVNADSFYGILDHYGCSMVHGFESIIQAFCMVGGDLNE